MIDERNGVETVVGEMPPTRLRITVRELIRARVELECESRRYFSMPCAPEEARRNGAARSYGPNSPAADAADVDNLVRVAEAGFAANRFILPLDDRQAETLDEDIDLRRTGQAVFLLLTPLQGG